MLNLTPHPITLALADGSTVTLPPSGTVARVSTVETLAGALDGVPVVTRRFGDVIGLPDDTSTPALVSAIVLSACSGRTNTYAPDTGPTAVRDATGNIVAVTRLVLA